MRDFSFNLQRFAVEIFDDKVTIPAGESYERDGVTYTAISDAQLNLDDEKVSGLSSGSVTAVISGAETSPTITFDATDGAITFNATGEDTLAVTLAGRVFKFIEGTATILGDSVKTGAVKFATSGTHSQADYQFTIEDSGEFSVSTELFTITSEKFSVAVSAGGITVNFGVSGTAIRDFTNQTFSLAEGTTVSTNLGDYTVSATVDDVAGGELSFTSNGVTFSPNENDGAIDISISRNGIPIFASKLSMTGGSVFVDIANNKVGITDGTTINVAFDNYTLTATAEGDAASTISLTADGIYITPNTGDGTLDITLTGTSSGSLSANIEVLSGGFLFGTNGVLSVTEGTELQMKFSDDYIVNLKATDAAGGAISLGADGITFAPYSDDGGLQLTITRDGETRSASLDVMGGSVTYKLDGSISLTQGTVIRNVFADGTTLTITANTDANGSIFFNPQTGLTITPATPDALNITLTRGDVTIGDITSITGTINYNGGVITASDGSALDVSYYNGEYNTHIQTTGGSSVIQFDGDRVVGTAGNGATLVLSYPNGVTWNINSNSTLTKIFNAEAILSEGANFSSNDTLSVFTLEKAGNYTLNGMNVTTFADNVEVQLTNYNTITFRQDLEVNIKTSISGNDLDVTASATEGQGTVTVSDSGAVTYDATNGTLQISIGLEDVIGESLLPSNFTISGGSITMGATDADGIKTAFIPAGTTISFTKNAMTFTAVAQNDINGRLWMRNGTVLYLHSYEEANFDLTATLGDTTVFNSTVTLGGAFSYNSATGTVGPVDSNTYNVHDSYIQLTVGNQSLRFTTNGDTFFAALDVDDNGKITFDFINENYNSMLVTMSLGGIPVFNSVVKVDGSLVVDPATQEITLTKDTTITMTQGNDVISVTALDDAGGKVSLAGSAISFTPNENDGALSVILSRNDTPIFGGALNVTSGTISFDTATQKVSFTEGTKIAFTLGTSQEMDIEIVGGDASFKVEADANGNFKLTPDENDGSIDVTFKQGGETVFKNNVSINGSIIFNPTTNLLTLTDGTTINFAFDNYTLTATAQGDAASIISLSASGISITPQKGDGTLDITLTGTSSSSLSANIEILSGGFVFGTNGALSVTEGTELQIDFGDGYIVNFKATDAAGGAISLGADGITFAPHSGDGDLQLTITRDGQTRSASLDVTGGSVTYKLDGTISLAQGTVVKNVFEDGNILTITANTDASGSINFNPQTGLTIAPTTADALNVSLTTGDLEVVKISSITGSVNYNGGVVTASDGTEAHLSIYGIWESELRTTGGTASIQFTADRTVYTANEGATFVLDYLDGSTVEIQNGSYSDIYGETIEDSIELISEGSIFRSNDGEFVFTLEKAGNYTLNGMNVTTSTDNVEVQLTNYNTITFAKDAPVKISTDGSAFMISESDDTIQAKIFGNIEVTDGTITFDNVTKKTSITAGTNIIITQGEKVIKFTAPEEISATYKLEEGIYYFDLDGNATTSISVTSGNTAVFRGDLELGGVISFRPDTGTFGLTGANSSHGDGTNSFAEFTTDRGYSIKLATHDTTVVFVPKIANGQIELNFPNERKHEMLFTISKDGATTFESQVTIGGTISFGVAAQELSLTKGTVLTLSGDGETTLEITALDDASGQLTFTDDGIKFAPNSGDGKLELNFVATGRKATLDVSEGAIILNSNRTLSLEKGTVANLAWEDGTSLVLTASDTGGSISFDAQGLKVSSAGELSIDLTTATGVQTTLYNLSGTVHYNAGKVLFDADSKLTATSTLGGQPVNLTLENFGEGGYVEISASGTNYVAGTGPLQITWARDNKSSTFAISNGSIFIGHGIFQIAEGTELSTDLKDLVPALYFTTTDAGKYTINGQTIETSATNMAMTATDDRMTFTPGSEIVGYDGMLFTGDGTVSLTKDGVILGAGIEATGFGTTNTFILTQKGTVTADGKIFELTEDVPTGISVKGAQDGFSFARTITAESEERLDIKDSPDIGKIFTEEFTATSDDTYRIQTDLLGLQQIIGITSPVTVKAAADIANEPERTVFDIVTDSEGAFTVGDKPYKISGDSSVVIKTDFEPDKSYVRGFEDLNGTVSGDFTEHAVTINGGEAAIVVHGDEDIDIAATGSGVEIFNLSDGATLESYPGTKKAQTDGAGNFVLGATEDESLLVQTGSAATFEFDDEEYLTAINGIGLELEGKLSHVGAYDEVLFVHGAEDATIETDAPQKVLTQMTGETLTLNGNELTLTADDDGIWISDKDFTGLDEGASLQVGEAGTYTSRTPYPDLMTIAELDAKAGDVIVGLYGNDAYIYDEKNPLITKKTPGEDIVKMFKPNDYEIIPADTTYNYNLTLEGGDLVVVEDTSKIVNVTVSNDTDTVVSQGTRVHVNMAEGNTWLFPTGGKMTLQGYDHSTGSGFGTTYSDIETAIYSGYMDFYEGVLMLGSAEIDMGEETLLMNFFDRAGNLQKIGYVSQSDKLDASDVSNDLILITEGYSTVRGGSGNDLIFGNAGDSIDAGGGENYIELATSDERDQYDTGAIIDITKGTNTITGFNTGFNSASDLIENSSTYWDKVFDGENVTINSDNGTTILEGVGNGESFVQFKESANGYTYKVDLAQKDSVIATGSNLADVYIGKNSGVDFTGYDGKLLIDLDDGRGTAGDSNVYFYGINKLTAGGGVTSLIGSAASDTLTAGTGKGSLWSNWGNDLMIGNTSADKIWSTKFFVLAGDGHDTISNFDFISAANSLTADRIDTGGNDINTAYLSGEDVVIELDNDSSLLLTDAAGKDFQINDMIAKVDRNVTFDGVANCYVANGGTSLTVDSNVTDAEIWLDNSHKAKFFGDILTLDASSVSGKTTLAGNEHDNVIIAGSGDSSMWGGAGNDLLIGGNSRNTFFYLLGNGNDTVSGVNAGDEIALSDITLDQISGTDITADTVAIRFNDGGSLTINGTADVTCVFADGSKYSANHAQREWISK